MTTSRETMTVEVTERDLHPVSLITPLHRAITRDGTNARRVNWFAWEIDGVLWLEDDETIRHETRFRAGCVCRPYVARLVRVN